MALQSHKWLLISCLKTMDSPTFIDTKSGLREEPSSFQHLECWVMFVHSTYRIGSGPGFSAFLMVPRATRETKVLALEERLLGSTL